MGDAAIDDAVNLPIAVVDWLRIIIELPLLPVEIGNRIGSMSARCFR